jgi:hypothetical protein
MHRPIISFLLPVLFFALPAVSQATGLANADTAVYNYLWLIVNFTAGATAIILFIKIIWALQNTEDRGATLKASVVNLVVLALVWGVGSAILNYADQTGTSLSGVSTAIQLKR